MDAIVWISIVVALVVAGFMAAASARKRSERERARRLARAHQRSRYKRWLYEAPPDDDRGRTAWR